MSSAPFAGARPGYVEAMSDHPHTDPLDPAATPSGYTYAQAERPALRRALASLPGSLLAALVSGLESHGDQLTPRYLFASRERAGCVVGAMMREYDPRRFASPGRLSYWLHHRGRGRAAAYGDPFASSPAVTALENVFDRMVALVRYPHRRLSERDAARSVGAWILADAEAELARRYDSRPARPRDRASVMEPALKGLAAGG